MQIKTTGGAKPNHAGAAYLLMTSALALILLSAPALAMPAGMGANCQKIYGLYEASKGPKAFAKGNTKACGYAYGKSSLAEARKAALNFYRSYMTQHGLSN